MARKRKDTDPLWVRWFREECRQLVCEPWMTLTMVRVLACLVERLRTNNSTYTTQAMIHDATGIAQPNISQALGVLQREGVVTQPRRGGRYYVSVKYVYSGDQSQLPYAQQQDRLRRIEKEQRNGQAQRPQRHRRAARGMDA